MLLSIGGRLRKIIYSVGSIGLTGFLQLMSVFLFFFYTDTVHLDPWLASLIIMISYGVWNAINDPLIGSISDRTQTRWGRRRPYMVMGIPILLLFSILIWYPPIGNEPLADPYSLSVFCYLLIIIALFELGFTMVTVPYGTIWPEMWTNIKDRSEVVIYRESLSVVGGILAMVVFPSIVYSFSDRFGIIRGWTWAGIIMTIIFVGSFLFSLFGISERKQARQGKALPFIASLKTVVSNKSWITAQGVGLMTGCTVDWVSSIYPFFITHSLGLGMEVTGIVMGVQMAATFSFFIVWRKISIRYGPKKAMAASMITFNLGPILGLVVSDIFGLAVMGFLGGITIGGLLLVRKLMVGDVIDEDEIKTGVRREGVYMGVGAAANKASMVIVGAGMAFLLSTLIGYVPGQPDPEFMNMGIRLGMAIFPIIFTAVLLIFLKFYPLGKKRVNEINRKIEEIHNEKANT